MASIQYIKLLVFQLRIEVQELYETIDEWLLCGQLKDIHMQKEHN
jgi:hypothetical protein